MSDDVQDNEDGRVDAYAVVVIVVVAVTTAAFWLLGQ